ncbi:hypothetical protein UFOVP105_10 [uncultured Caudovirales phage]|uniref:Uncharacterized protein n=1 Tax=uncultured Caudovirales phage TaxID=2100421 RepID=A0A6J5L3S6_9CAUD|nr:hypothetical protein UFOVP105_10 [uncultured Caudovirales phage]
MATRTISEIYNSMIAEKESFASLSDLSLAPDTAQTFLTDLTSSSKVAIWRLLFWVVAVAIWTHEQVFELFRAEIVTLGTSLITGTRNWYRLQSEAFQYGDALTWNPLTLKFEYARGSTGLKIVKHASVREAVGILRIKVAKSDGAGGLTPLSGPEQTAFETYINQIKFAGTSVSVVNLSADLLKLQIDVYYNPMLMTETGENIVVSGSYPVRDAINNHLIDLPFDGTFNLTKLTDAIQNAYGVIDTVINLSEAKSGSNPYVSTGQNYIANAGYLKIDPTFPLNSTAVINYIAKID